MYGVCHAEGNIGVLMRCSICGRQIKTAESCKRGYGPVCYRKKFGIDLRVSNRGEEESMKSSDYNLPGQISLEDYLQMLPGK